MSPETGERNELFRPQAVFYQQEKKTGAAVIIQSSAIRTFVWSSIGLLALVLLVLFFIRYKETQPARGILEHSLASIKVKSPASASVVNIPIREGDIVRKGQTLMVLSTDILDGQGNNQKHAVIERLFIDQQELTKKAELEKRHFAIEYQRLATSTNSLRAAAEVLKIEANLLSQQMVISENVLSSLDQLLQSANISQAQYDNESASNLDLAREQNNIEGREIEISSDLMDRELQLELLKLNFDTQRLENEKQQLRITKEIDSLQQQTQITIQAPQDGVVTSLAVERSSPVSLGQTLVIMAPENGELKATLFVPSTVIGRIHTEQELLLALDAFPITEFGYIHGSVTAISRAPLDPRETLLPVAGLTEPVFKVSAKLNQNYIEGPDTYPLLSGLQLSANFVIEDLSLLEFIFKPVLKLKGKLI